MKDALASGHCADRSWTILPLFRTLVTRSLCIKARKAGRNSLKTFTISCPHFPQITDGKKPRGDTYVCLVWDYRLTLGPHLDSKNRHKKHFLEVLLSVSQSLR